MNPTSSMHEPLYADPAYKEITFHYCVRVAQEVVRDYGGRRLGIHDAGELAAEIALRFDRRANDLASRGDSIRHPKAYLYQIARYAYLEFCRSEKRDHERFLKYAQTLVSPELPELSIADQDLNPLQLAFVERLRSKLKPKQKRILRELADPESRCRSEQANRLRMAPNALSMAIDRFLTKVDRLRQVEIVRYFAANQYSRRAMLDDIRSFARTRHEHSDYILFLLANIYYNGRSLQPQLSRAYGNLHTLVSTELIDHLRLGKYRDHYFEGRMTRAMSAGCLLTDELEGFSKMMVCSASSFLVYGALDEVRKNITCCTEVLSDHSSLALFFRNLRERIPSNHEFLAQLEDLEKMHI